MSIKLRDTMRDTVRAVAESAGIISPNLIDAQSAAELRRQELASAQAAIESAEDELNRLHDRGDATQAQVTAAEAVLADVKITAARAQRAYAGAEKRLTAARDADSEKTKGAMRVKLDVALKERAKLAERINDAAIVLAGALADFNSHDDLIRQVMAAGVVGRDATYTLNIGRRVVDLALRKHGALEGAGTGIIELPGAVELVSQHNAALSAV
jgi:chromosome segregation ATPase